jgi:uncharacterized membrane protein YgdD (TMEM256/DUF423 family)
VTVRAIFVTGALSGFLGVAAGAFGAHALRAHLAPESVVVFETGVRYQLIHALAMLVVAVAAFAWPETRVARSAVLFAAGTVLFSGSLYALALSGVRGFGAVTPAGGLCLLAGWLYAAWSVARSPLP